MAQGVDLNKIKSEIDYRKKERGIVTETVQGARLLPKDQFLNGLIASLDSGKATAASNLIKLVENKTAAKHGEVVRHNIEPVASAPIHQPRRHEEVDMSPERDEQLFADLERKRKTTLAESIQGYMNTPAVGAPMQNNMPQQFSDGRPMQLNEAFLTENVQKIVNNYLVENFGPVLEEAIKTTILEMYAVDRIKSVMTENKDIIKTIVVETIREIQARSKKPQ